MASVSKSEDKMLNIQKQLRENQSDLTDFLKDMDSWENDIKQKDEELKKTKLVEEPKLPPVRNSLDKKKKKKRNKPVHVEHVSNGKETKKRISGYDYRSWDKLDIDKLCDDVDEHKTDSSEYETDEEWEIERKKQQATIEKDRGNELFKKGDYVSAVEAYTAGMEMDPCNPLLPANRAMALLKQEKYAAAETDCLTALTLDPLYIKAHLRLGSARFEMKKYKEAKEVFEKVLLLEPQNKKATFEIERIEKELLKQQRVSQTSALADPEAGIVKPVTKNPEQRSKKPLKRIEIEEVGVEDDLERQSAIAKVVEGQGQMKKSIVEKDAQLFEKFTSDNSVQDSSSHSKTKSVTAPLSSVSNENMKKTKENHEKHATTDGDELKLNLSQSDSKKVTPKSESVSPRLSESVSPRSMPIAQTSFQFQADYKVLKSSMENFYQYVKRIVPENYPKLFGTSLESGILLNMMTVFKEYFIPAGEDVYQHLLHLTNVKRFSMTVMFFSQKEQKVIKYIFQHLRDSGQVPESDLTKLTKQYQIT